MSDALRKSVEEAQKVFERCAANAKAQRNNLADDMGSYLILQAQFMAFDLAATHLKSILDTDADAEKLKQDLARASEPTNSHLETDGRPKEESAALAGSVALWRCANPTACGWCGSEIDATSITEPQMECPKCSGPVVPVSDSCPKCHTSFPHENAKKYQGLRHCPTCGATPVSSDLTQCRRCKVVLPVTETTYHGAWDVLCESCFKTITAQKATASPKET
jgi:hypothetical protein